MRRLLLSLVAAGLLVSGCSSNEGGATASDSPSVPSTTSTTSATPSPSATSTLSATLCEQFCEQVRALQAQDCQPPFDKGSVCSARLTDKVMLAMQMEQADDGTDPKLVTALADVSAAGEAFGTAKCFQQTKLDLNCSIAALNVDTNFNIVAVRLGIL